VTPAITANQVDRSIKRALRQSKHDYQRLAAAKSDTVASVNEVLIPIRIEFDIDGFKIKDYFTWNMNETILTPEKFAEYTCNDLDLPFNVYGAQIVSSLKSQIAEFKQFFMTMDLPPQPDSRVPITLDVRAGKLYLRDRFEWDLHSNLQPEQFASILVKEMGLGGEFISLIANSIREQLFKSRLEGDNVNMFPLESRFRGEEEAKGWCPSIDFVPPEDADKFDNSKDRRNRYYFPLTNSFLLVQIAGN
jgi:chromatin structure-remodeling complex subunit SFH1